MNVRQDADREFIRLLKRDDPRRYAQLQANMRQCVQNARDNAIRRKATKGKRAKHVSKLL